MPTTKIVAHQYICIRAIEAVLAQITPEFTPAVAYRISSINLPRSATTKVWKVNGKLLRFSTVKDTEGKLQTSFSCTLELRKLLGLWEPVTFNLVLEGWTYKGAFACSCTYNILIRWIVKKTR
ncbi:MAG: hypothetical protein AAB948_04250 [Patescibacteria group bacterium]